MQGLPFFAPVAGPGARFDVYAPVQEDGRSVREAFDFFMRPPYFPVRVADLPGDIRFHDCPDGEMKVGTALVTCATVPHVGDTQRLPHRAGAGRPSPTSPTTSSPSTAATPSTDAVLELADGADLLIHDAQYTPPEFARKSHWGHCTVEYAVFVAKEAGAKRLALFHHDPTRDDDALDEAARAACRRASATARASRCSPPPRA